MSYCITGKCSIIIDASRTIIVVPKLVRTYSSYRYREGSMEIRSEVDSFARLLPKAETEMILIWNCSTRFLITWSQEVTTAIQLHHCLSTSHYPVQPCVLCVRSLSFPCFPLSHIITHNALRHAVFKQHDEKRTFTEPFSQVFLTANRDRSLLCLSTFSGTLRKRIQSRSEIVSQPLLFSSRNICWW